MPGAWLSLLPVTDSVKAPTTSNNASTQSSPSSSTSTLSSSSINTSPPTIDSCWFHSTSAHSSIKHESPSSSPSHPPHFVSKTPKPSELFHDHHPSPNHFLKPIFLQSARPKKKSSHPTLSHSFSSNPPLLHCLKLLEDSNQSPSASSSFQKATDESTQGFQIRELRVCDIEKVKELHCSSLPVSYPSYYFYDLLQSNQGPKKIGLVATLPVNGYFEPICSSYSASHPQLSFMPNGLSTPPALSHAQSSHHITSPLSGRKPISLDIIGCITARIEEPGECSGMNVNEKITYVRILTLCIHPDYRRSGVGKSLVQSMIKKLTRWKGEEDLCPSDCNGVDLQKLKIRLHVQATNQVGFEFYLKQGFRLICFKEGYYSHQLVKPLDPDLTRVEPSKTSDDGLEEERCKAGRKDVKDEDAWFLELGID